MRSHWTDFRKVLQLPYIAVAYLVIFMDFAN